MLSRTDNFLSLITFTTNQRQKVPKFDISSNKKFSYENVNKKQRRDFISTASMLVKTKFLFSIVFHVFPNFLWNSWKARWKLLKNQQFMTIWNQSALQKHWKFLNFHLLKIPGVLNQSVNRHGTQTSIFITAFKIPTKNAKVFNYFVSFDSYY